MIKTCQRCGVDFEACSNAMKYCDDCRPIVRNEYNRRCYEKRKLKLIREILSTAKKVLGHD